MFGFFLMLSFENTFLHLTCVYMGEQSRTLLNAMFNVLDKPNLNIITMFNVYKLNTLEPESRLIKDLNIIFFRLAIRPTEY